MNLWIKYGLMGGIAGLAFTLGNVYFLKLGLGSQFLAVLIISIVFSVLVNKEYQRENSGSDHGYGQTFKLSFLTLMFGSVISSIMLFIMMRFVDPSIYETLMQFGIDFSKSLMETMGMPEDQIEEAMMLAEEQAENTEYGVSSLFVSMVQSLGVDLVFAALISIFIKKKSKQLI